MTDDTGVPEEDLEEEDNPDRVSEPSGSLQVQGNNTVLLLKGPSPHPTPFDHIKGCVGLHMLASSNPARPDTYLYLVMVQDGFEWREIEECFNVFSEKEYEPRLKFRTVN
jgi:hypothetical protein